MKIQIRPGTFETNSSSTHSLVIESTANFDKWRRGELVYSYDNEELVPVEFAEEDEDGYKAYYTYDEFFGELDYETFSQSYTSESGDEITAFGYYGYS